MIKVNFEHNGNEYKFDVERALLASATDTLAGQIVDSLDESNGDFGHLFTAEKYDTYSWDLSDDDTLAKFINASISAEKKARENDDLDDYKHYLSDEIDSILNSFGTYYSESFYGDAVHEHHSGLDSAIIDALSELEGLEVDPEIMTESFEESLRYAMENVMARNDESSATDLIPNHCRAEIVVALGFDWNNDCIEDRFVQHESVCNAVSTVIVDDKLQPLFTMANVAPKAFMNYLQEQGYDEEVVARYKELKDTSNSSKPQVLSCESIVHVLDNASYGGIPMLTAYIAASEFVSRDITKGFYLDNGVIGLEDMINGSGHNEGMEKDTKLFVSVENISSVRALTGSSMRDNVYGYYRPALYANVTQEKSEEKVSKAA